jgi:GT2 family glycosyltransferase
MSKTPPLLVVTPTLGRSPWLDRTVESVTATAGTFARHMLVAPPDRLADLQQRFPACIVVADRVARGVYPAINAGIAAAAESSWQWFTWINDDDELAPGFAPHLEHALGYDARLFDAPWLFGPVQLRDGRNNVLGNLAVARTEKDIVPLLQSHINPLNQQGLLAPRAWVDQLGSLREDFRICADLDFWLRAVVGGARFQCSRETVAIFRLRAGQISGDVTRHQAEFRAVVRALAPEPVGAARRVAARARFRLGNLATYAGRVRRSGWKGGFALLQQPAQKNS